MTILETMSSDDVKKVQKHCEKILNKRLSTHLQVQIRELIDKQIQLFDEQSDTSFGDKIRTLFQNIEVDGQERLLLSDDRINGMMVIRTNAFTIELDLSGFNNDPRYFITMVVDKQSALVKLDLDSTYGIDFDELLTHFEIDTKFNLDEADVERIGKFLSGMFSLSHMYDFIMKDALFAK